MYRIKAEIAGTDRKPGALLFPWRTYRGTVPAGHIALTEWPSGWGKMLHVPTDAVDAVDQYRAADFGEAIEYYLHGAEPIPGFAPIENLDHGLNAIAAGAGMKARDGVARIMAPGFAQSVWARAFLNMTQAGAFDGSGYLLLYRSAFDGDLPRMARFALCDHRKVSGAGANPGRGWHPGRCSICGLDMTVDSGD